MLLFDHISEPLDPLLLQILLISLHTSILIASMLLYRNSFTILALVGRVSSRVIVCDIFADILKQVLGTGDGLLTSSILLLLPLNPILLIQSYLILVHLGILHFSQNKLRFERSRQIFLNKVLDHVFINFAINNLFLSFLISILFAFLNRICNFLPILIFEPTFLLSIG